MAWSAAMEKAFVLVIKRVSLPSFNKPLFSLQRVLLLIAPCLVAAFGGHWDTPACRLHIPEMDGYSRAGDVLLGGVFPLHMDTDRSQTSYEAEPKPITCRTFVLQNYYWLQAMVFAVDEINKNPDLLPNITLGFQIYDSCADMLLALQGTLWMLTGQSKPILNYRSQLAHPLSGIVGDGGSKCSLPMARVLGLYRHPQISYFSTLPVLSDRNQFPSFFRTIPSDDFQFHGLAELVIHLNWTWVGVLAADNDYGQNGVNILKAQLQKAGTCVAFTEKIILSREDKNAVHIVKVIKNSTPNVIVILCLDSHLVPVMDEILRQNLTRRIFVASEAWSTSELLSLEKYRKILTGTIGLAINAVEMPGFTEYLNSLHPSNVPTDIFIRKFWEKAFGCKWQDDGIGDGSWNNQPKLCTGAESLRIVSGQSNDIANPRVAYNVYIAVYAFAYALQDLGSCKPPEGLYHHATCSKIFNFQLWEVLHYVKALRSWKQTDSRPFFDSSGISQSHYDIVQWQLGTDGTIQHKTVGHYKSSNVLQSSLRINKSAVWWEGTPEVPISRCSHSCSPGFRKVPKVAEPVCCFECAPCPQGEISKEIDSVECSSCPWDQWPNSRHNRCLPKAIEFLSYTEPLGFIISAISIILSVIPVAILGLFIKLRHTPIVKANNRFISYLLLVSLTMCLLCALSYVGYPSQEKCLFHQVAFGITFAVCISCVLAKTTLVFIAFTATKPNSSLKRWVGQRFSCKIISFCILIQVLICVSWLIIAPPFSEYDTHTYPYMIIVQCHKGSSFAFWCMLGYLGLLAAICLILAFLARKLPDNFNESKFITFSMLAFLSVWLSFIPAYLSTRGKYMMAMEIFAILSSSSSLVCCIFFPKCYIILLKPEMNIREYLMGRDIHQRKKNKAI